MKLVLSFALILMSGCATNPYKKFYNDQTGGKDLSALPVVIPTDDPVYHIGSDPQEESKKMIENGYALLGYSSFNGPQQDVNDAINFAKSIHAETVLVFSKYASTQSGSMPITTPTSQTSFTTANASAYGSNGGYAHASGYGTTTTYGTQTNYVPFSVDRYEQGAQYWIKMKPRVLGLMVKDLSEEKRKSISSNKGVEVSIVIKGSPAFNADILVGDIIKKIGDREISDIQSFHSVVEYFAGQKVEIDLFRDGKDIKKTTELNERVN